MMGDKKNQLTGESQELEHMILRVLRNEDGLTDLELAERLKKEGISFSACRNLCLQLAAKGLTKRERAQGRPMVNRIIKGEHNGI